MSFLILVSSFLFFGVATAEDPVRVWALIVVGNTDESYMNFRWDGAYMYHLFKSHIFADGLVYLSTSADPGVNSTTTKSNIRQAINTTLANWSRLDGTPSNDIVFIYYSGHGGGYNTIENRLQGGRYNDTEGDTTPIDEDAEIVNATGSYGVDECWKIGNSTNTELYWDDELMNDLRNVDGKKVLALQTCFGGGFIDDLSGSNMVIMTSTNETYTSFGDAPQDPAGTPGDGFAEWSERFMDAFHGVRASANHSDAGNVIHYWDWPVNADNTSDGRISLKEAWDWAWIHDEMRPNQETPWLDDDGNNRPTYLNNDDELDSDDGTNASQIFLPLRCEIAVDKLEPIEHYSIFQVFNGTMYSGVAGNNSEITMTYDITVSRKDSNNPPATVYANVALKRTRRDNSSDCYNIATVMCNITPGQTQTVQLVWNESRTHSLKPERQPQFWNISCSVDVTTSGWYDLNLLNNQICNDTVEGRYLVGDADGNGFVDIFDAIILSSCYGKNANQTGFNPLVNFQTESTESGLQVIDIYDAILLADNFNKDIFSMRGAGSSDGGTQSALLANTVLKVEPSSMAVFKGETFTVDVKLTDVADLYGWEFKLYWNRTVLNCTNVSVNVPSVWQNTTQQYGSGLENSFNTTHGRYFKAMTPTDPAPSFNGSMTLVTLTFSATETGATQLMLQGTKLGDRSANPIAHSVTSGSVDVYYGRYMRTDTHTVNGLTAYKLGVTRSASSLFYTKTADGSLTVYWGVRAWVRHSNGVEQEISLDGQTGTPKAVVSRSTTGGGMQSNTVNVAQTTLQSTDSLVVRVYMKLGSGSWNLCATFTTEQLQATKINSATWTVYYHTDRFWSSSTNRTTGKFYWGTATYNSRIQNLRYS